jgi:hypothetical protein
MTNHATNANNGHSIPWVDPLLATPILDHRKDVLWRILAPYFINMKELSYGEAFTITKGWLNKCYKIRTLDFNADHKIRNSLKAASNHDWRKRITNRTC